MSNASTEITDGVSLQQFVLLAKKSKGKALVAIIDQAISAPNVFVFGELLNMPNVQELGNSADPNEKAALQLLQIFAFGTFADYKANIATIGELAENKQKKLRKLTIVSLASQTKLILYSTLLQQLEMENIRELEDLIIECIYSNLIQATLDQKLKHLEVQFVFGRDVKADSLDEILSKLTGWSARSEELLTSIQEKISYANSVTEEKKKKKEEHETKLETMKVALKASMDSDHMTGSDDSGFGHSGHPDDRSSKKRSQKKGRRG